MNNFCYKEVLIKQFLISVAAVNPAKLIAENFKVEKGILNVCNKTYDISDKNVYLVGFGKAVVGMASQCEKILGEHLKYGIICGPHNIQSTFQNNNEFTLKLNSVIEVHEGAKNNLPDSNAQKAADAIINLVQRLKFKKDCLIILMSGGGSALFPKPKPGITLAEKLETVNLLMSSGADIQELNTVRKKLSLVKGGGLASFSYPVKSICLIISDVINDPIDVIASGPTVPNLDSQLAAFNTLQKYNLGNKVPTSILEETKKFCCSFNSTMIKNNEFTHVDNFVIGNNQKALLAAKNYAEELGFEAVILSHQVKGSVLSVSDFYTNMIFEILNGIHKQTIILKDSFFKGHYFNLESSFLEKINKLIKKPHPKTISIIGGGETTVKVEGPGKGGRNQELALLLLAQMYNLKIKYPHLFDEYEITFLCAGTDGIDGPTNAAGALGDLKVVEKARKLNLNINEFLSKNDSNNFFSKIDNGSYLIKTGHTGTNVMDIHIFVIYKKKLHS